MRKIALLSAAAGLTVLAAGIAGAATTTTTPGSPPPDGPPGPAGMMGHWGGHGPGQGMRGGFGHGMWASRKADMDTNKDGTVSRSELQSFLTKRFSEADTNHDGKLSEAEIKAWHEAEKARRQDAAFKRMDSNGDGGISKDESISKVLAHFDEVDTNHDGVVSPEERKAAHDQMRAKTKEWRKSHPGAPKFGDQ